MLRNLFRPKEPTTVQHPVLDGRRARVPDGVRVYAIGDVHGCLDQLDRLHAKICDDADARPAGTANFLVYVGDYVDRGPDSRGVVEQLSRAPIEGFRIVHLLGNHDAWVREFVSDPHIGPHWLRYGGGATLASYGIPATSQADDRDVYDELRHAFAEALPAGHLEFLNSLSLCFEMGDYFFVHAGVRPTVALDRQTPHDLIWIRDPFLNFEGEFGRIVVHGHTPDQVPALRRNRIGIDTGAFMTGTLTCAVLEGDTHRFIQASASAGSGPSAQVA